MEKGKKVRKKKIKLNILEFILKENNHMKKSKAYIYINSMGKFASQTITITIMYLNSSETEIIPDIKNTH
jgi:hypothetical protein